MMHFQDKKQLKSILCIDALVPILSSFTRVLSPRKEKNKHCRHCNTAHAHTYTLKQISSNGILRAKVVPKKSLRKNCQLTKAALCLELYAPVHCCILEYSRYGKLHFSFSCKLNKACVCVCCLRHNQSTVIWSKNATLWVVRFRVKLVRTPGVTHV